LKLGDGGKGFTYSSYTRKIEPLIDLIEEGEEGHNLVKKGGKEMA